MTTLYDWITVAVFSGLIVLFLHRSDRASASQDPMFPYLVASAGCALVNWLGNEGHHLIAGLAGLGLGLFIWRILHPFGRRR